MVETTPEIQTDHLQSSFSLSKATALPGNARKLHNRIVTPAIAVPNVNAFIKYAQNWWLRRKCFPGDFCRSIGLAK